MVPMTDLSLGEFEAIASKALRGAGYPWGVVEEGAAACRTLAEWGTDPSTSLLRLLNAVAGAVPHYWPDEQLSTASGYLCPIALTCLVHDGGALPPLEQLEPRLLEPELLRPALVAPGDQPGSSATRIRVANNVLAQLERFAALTYAPDTEASRAAGAGPA